MLSSLTTQNEYCHRCLTKGFLPSFCRIEVETFILCMKKSSSLAFHFLVPMHSGWFFFRKGILYTFLRQFYAHKSTSFSRGLRVLSSAHGGRRRTQCHTGLFSADFGFSATRKQLKIGSKMTWNISLQLWNKMGEIRPLWVCKTRHLFCSL